MGANQSIPSPPVAVEATSCPIKHNQSPTDLNPLNRMPLTPEQQQAKGQTIALPLERTISTIPRAVALGDPSPSACPVASGSGSNISPPGQKLNKEDQWEYPSPQQFYNALVRKGWETPEESVVMMVNIHNWLNEAAWQQVRTWEEKHNGLVLYLRPPRG